MPTSILKSARLRPNNFQYLRALRKQPIFDFQAELAFYSKCFCISLAVMYHAVKHLAQSNCICEHQAVTIEYRRLFTCTVQNSIFVAQWKLCWLMVLISELPKLSKTSLFQRSSKTFLRSSERVRPADRG